MNNAHEIFKACSDIGRIASLALSGLSVIVAFHAFGVVFFITNASSFESSVHIRPISQRCGDKIYFFFNDRSGKNIDPAKFQSITIVDNVVGDGTDKANAERKGMKGFMALTRCGLLEMRVTIAYQNKKMNLILKRIPGDRGDILVYSIPFSKGTFTFDFENNFDWTCDNVRGKGDECIIAPKRLKKITPDRSKQGATQTRKVYGRICRPAVRNSAAGRLIRSAQPNKSLDASGISGLLIDNKSVA